MVRECVGERARRCAGRRVDHKPGRFVYNNQRLIFVNNFERDIFRREEVGRRRYQFNFNLIMFAEFI